MMLEPWIVEAALAGFAEKRPTPEQQKIGAKGHPNTGQGPVARLAGR